MASDNRDWYRDWWRKKTGYVERASFRMSEAERKRQKNRAAWRRDFLLAATALGVVVAISKVRKAKR